jgi:hypothetical protein
VNHEPVLETARLRLRAMLPTDIDGLLLIFADPMVIAAFGEESSNGISEA